MTMLRAIAFSCAMGLLTVSPAQSATLVKNYDLAEGQLSATVAIDQFDAGLGTLGRIFLEVTSAARFRINSIFYDGSDAVAQVTAVSTAGLFAPGLIPKGSFERTGTSGPRFLGVIPGQSTSYSFAVPVFGGIVARRTIDSQPAIAAFVGNGSLDATVFSSSSLSCLDCGNYNISASNSHQVALKVTYEYTPTLVGVVPEPATWAMLIVGFGLVGRAVRRPPASLRKRLISARH